MYVSDKPQAIDFYKEEVEDPESHKMIVDVVTGNTQLPPGHQIGDTTSSGGEENCANPCSDLKTPKKRAETWVQEETRVLIGLRREIDSLFNTSKSNKHLWDQISMKMREKGFDRSPTMCTDKWRNLFKEFKKAKQNQDRNGSAKMSYYKEIEEILRERINSGGGYKSPPAPKVDSFMHFAEKGMPPFSILLKFSVRFLHPIFPFKCIGM